MRADLAKNEFLSSNLIRRPLTLHCKVYFWTSQTQALLGHIATTRFYVRRKKIGPKATRDGVAFATARYYAQGRENKISPFGQASEAKTKGTLEDGVN